MIGMNRNCNIAEAGSILAVDDTDVSLKVLSDLLTEAGYLVRSALTGQIALRSAWHRPPDLVLLDVRMPDLDGFEVCRQLKAHHITRDVPVIFISGLAETEEKIRGFEAGGVDYVTKPYQRTELLARVAAHVNLRLAQRQVAAQNEELRQYREHLEELVAQRTAELKDSNQRLELMSFALDHVREAAYLIEKDGGIVYVNQEACRAHSNSAEELRSMYVSDIDPDYSPDMVKDAWQEARATGKVTFETRHRRRDGTAYPVEITSSYIDHDEGLVLCLARDISERREAERRLAESYGFLQELTARRESAREEERKRIAREVHDELGQQVTALRLGIGTVRYRLAGNNPSLTEQLLDLAVQADETIKAVRSIATALRPPVLERGIGPALEWLAGQFRASTGVACSVVLSEPCSLAEGTAVALFRCVQESLTNVARHARATAVLICLSGDGENYRLEVSDNGAGFDLSTKRTEAFGLLGMRERVLMLGGVFEIDTALGKGTSLRFQIPYANAAETP